MPALVLSRTSDGVGFEVGACALQVSHFFSAVFEGWIKGSRGRGGRGRRCDVVRASREMKGLNHRLLLLHNVQYTRNFVSRRGNKHFFFSTNRLY